MHEFLIGYILRLPGRMKQSAQVSVISCRQLSLFLLTSSTSHLLSSNTDVHGVGASCFQVLNFDKFTQRRWKNRFYLTKLSLCNLTNCLKILNNKRDSFSPFGVISLRAVVWILHHRRFIIHHSFKVQWGVSLNRQMYQAPAQLCQHVDWIRRTRWQRHTHSQLRPPWLLWRRCREFFKEELLISKKLNRTIFGSGERQSNSCSAFSLC